VALPISHRTISRWLQQRAAHACRTPHPPSHALTLAISLVLPVRRWDCPFPGPMNYGPDSPAIWLPEEDVLNDPTLVRKVWPVLFRPPFLSCPVCVHARLVQDAPTARFRVPAAPLRCQHTRNSAWAAGQQGMRGTACDARMNRAGLSALEEEGASVQSSALVAEVMC
jgi:hypothetical protein